MAQADAVSPHHHDLKNDDGTWRYTNALARESSPYLLQHAHNPVDWYAWGPDAFDLARRTGRPIFLSVGYSTCYWCHVMERQVFENPAIAATMNALFVNVKVDREERPDVDDIYMTAVQMMTRHGGWPMSVFLTPPGADGPEDPGLQPFYAGTYIPPEPRYGMPGFPELLAQLDKAWREQREQVLAGAQRVAAAIQEHLGRRDEPGPLDAALVQEAVTQLLGSYDADHGGFGGPPKFPQPSNLLFLLQVQRNNANPELWKALAYTLDRMARGGMNDQIGGGFHRYATDAIWLVPHFEKMLYDNGQLVEAYCIAHDIAPPTDDPGHYERVVRATCDYVLREMTDASGTFWSAQDAEVDAREGGNYVWTEQEVPVAVADADLADLARVLYGFDKGANFQDPHVPGAERVNVLYLPRPLHAVAAERGVPLAELIGLKARIDRRMLAVRDRRPQPSTDDKVLAGWNGLMIAGFARAARTFEEPRYARAAAAAAACILEQMRQPNGGLYRTMRGDTVRIPGFLDDYALFVHGLLELHRTDGQARWLEAATALMARAGERFGAAAGGYFDTLDGQSDLFVRTRGTYDGAVCSGNSQMVHNLLDLHELTGDATCLHRAVLDLRSFATSMRRLGIGMVHMHHALLRALASGPARAALAAPAGASSPEAPPPVALAVEPAAIDLAGADAATARVRLTIAAGHHLNAHAPGVEGLVPTAIEMVEGAGLKLDVDYPEGESKTYAFADQPVRVYEGRVEIEIRLARVGAAAGGRARLMLRYQACTERACLAPQTIAVPLEIRTAP